MRASRALRRRAEMRDYTRAATEIAAVMTDVLDARAKAESPPTGFAPTAGYASTQIAGDRWMPHDRRPIVGFTPNTLTTERENRP